MDRLFACNRESARVWNKCLSLAKTYHQTYQKWINQAVLQQQTKRRFALHSQSIQAVFENYLYAREAAWRAIQKGIRTARYPYKTKQTYPTKWKKDGFRLFPNGKIVLSIGEFAKEKGKNQLFFMFLEYHKEKSRKSNFVMTTKPI